MTKILVVGHSHTVAIRDAVTESPPEDADFSIVYFQDITKNVANPFEQTEDGRERYNAAAIERAFAGRGPDGYDLVVSSVGGNVANILGLMEHPIPFDFDLPKEPTRPRIAGATRVTYAFIKAAVTQLSRRHLQHMAALRHSTTARIVHIETPPPNGDDAYVMTNLDKYFRANHADEAAIAPRWLRYKLWRVHSDLIRGTCRRLGIEFVAAPAHAQDGEGFMIPRAYHKDATHGNVWYGGQVVDQIRSLAQAG